MSTNRHKRCLHPHSCDIQDTLTIRDTQCHFDGKIKCRRFHIGHHKIGINRRAYIFLHRSCICTSEGRHIVDRGYTKSDLTRTDIGIARRYRYGSRPIVFRCRNSGCNATLRGRLIQFTTICIPCRRIQCTIGCADTVIHDDLQAESSILILIKGSRKSCQCCIHLGTRTLNLQKTIYTIFRNRPTSAGIRGVGITKSHTTTGWSNIGVIRNRRAIFIEQTNRRLHEINFVRNLCRCQIRVRNDNTCHRIATA